MNSAMSGSRDRCFSSLRRHESQDLPVVPAPAAPEQAPAEQGAAEQGAAEQGAAADLQGVATGQSMAVWDIWHGKVTAARQVTPAAEL